MDLLDRYLQSVKRHLPWQRQDDILAELRANLEAQLEEREAELGRPLTPAEAEAWIKQLGSPLQMAARYQPQQYLIGPGLFPIYWYVLRLVFFWSVAIYATANAVLFAVNGASVTAIVEALLRIPVVLFTSAAWVTLIFAGLEFASRRYPSQCAPLLHTALNLDGDALPALDAPPVHGRRPRTYAHAVAEFIFGVLFLAWLLLVPGHPFLLMGPGAIYLDVSPFRLAPVWVQFYWAVVALNVVQIVWSAANLVTGAWQGPRLLQHLAAKALAFVPLGLLLAVPDHLLFVLKNPAANEVSYGHTLRSINEVTHTGLMFTFAICILQFAWEVVRSLRAASQHPADAH